MAALTADEASALSTNFLDVAKNIEDYRNKKKLSGPDDECLGKLQKQLSKSGQDILAASVSLVMNDTADSLQRIDGVTARINATLKKLATVQKVIDLTSDLLTLGVDILSLKITDIPADIKKLEVGVKQTFRK